MREIKFRAWDEQKKVMHFDFQFIKSGDSGNDWIIFQSDKENFNGNFNPYFSQQLKIMQHTGLKDKNGVEIYESDVVKVIIDNEVYGIGEVVFCLGSYSLEFIDDKEANIEPIITVKKMSLNQELEVICNIYENHELLEQTKCGS